VLCLPKEKKGKRKSLQKSEEENQKEELKFCVLPRGKRKNKVEEAIFTLLVRGWGGKREKRNSLAAALLSLSRKKGGEKRWDEIY